MGHFSQTCLLSHLPVTGGTPIRVCLLSSSPYYSHSDRHGEAWSFRSIPFRAEYNDYGSIENVHPEDQVLVDLALAQFNRDAVEIPQGDNPYHDPPVTRGMPAEGWWDALWEGRLRVWEGYGEPLKVRVPKGIPTWRRVLKTTTRAVEKGKLIPGSTVANRIAYGLVRVTYHGDYSKRGEWYAAIRPVLERRYKVTERYENGPERHRELLEKCPDKDFAVYGDVWFEVAPKDGPYPPVNPARQMRDKALLETLENPHSSRRARKSLCIGWAFIREDAWQATLPLGGLNTGWGDSPTVESLKAKLSSAIEKSTARKGLKETPGRYGTGYLLERECYFLKSTPPFVEGMAGQVSDLLVQLDAGTATPEQSDRVVQAVAEYGVISSVMSTVCIAPHPTHGGPQDGEWEAHVAFHNAMAPVIASAANPPEEDDEEVDPDGIVDLDREDALWAARNH